MKQIILTLHFANAGYAHAKLGTPSQRPFGGFVQRMPGTRCVLTPTSGVLVIGSWIYLPSTCRGLDSAAFINSRVLLQGWEGDERFSVFFFAFYFLIAPAFTLAVVCITACLLPRYTTHSSVPYVARCPPCHGGLVHRRLCTRPARMLPT